jgi:Mrp family chromosome partitioning ATPase
LATVPAAQWCAVSLNDGATADETEGERAAVNTTVCAAYTLVKSHTGYEVSAADGAVRISATRVRWQGEELRGEVTIYTESDKVGPVAMVFTSANSRRDVAALMSEGKEVNIALNELCNRVIEVERTGSCRVVRLCDVPRPSREREYAVPNLPPLPRSSMAIWFGDGGTGKSMIALYTAGELAKQGIRVLYLDWELSADEHRIRYEQLFGTRCRVSCITCSVTGRSAR